jgi:AraC family transcriptional regulator
MRLQLHDGFQKQFQLSQLAQAAGVHPVYAVRCFKKRYGCTIGEYLRNLRLAYALGLVAETDLPLSEISEQAGFSDQPHLTRLFKKATGKTPGSIRKVPLRGRLEQLRASLVHPAAMTEVQSSVGKDWV